jgi:alanyl-tRNA synthetase
MADGGRPGPKGRGHVVRVLFRRLLKAADLLRIDARAVFPKLAQVVAEVDRKINPNLQPESAAIVEVFDQEAQRMQARMAAARG